MNFAPASAFALAGHTFGPHAAAVAGTSVAMLALGVTVMVTEGDRDESLFFYLFSLTVAVWLFSFAWMYAAPDREAAYEWAKAAYLGIPLIPGAMYHFTVESLGIGRRRRGRLSVLWGLGAAFAVLVLGTGAVIPGVRDYPWGYYTSYSAWGAPFVAFTVAGIGLALREFWREYRASLPGRRRRRLRLVLAAFCVGSLAVVDFLPTYGVAVYPFGYAAIAAMVGILAIVLLRYRLVDFTPAFASDEILATIADPVVVCDARGRVRVANGAVRSLLGYAPDELEGEPVALLAGEETDARDALREALEETSVRNREMQLVSRDGEAVEVSVSVSPLRDREGERVVGSVLIARDVRELRRAKERIRFESLHDSLTGLPNRTLLLDRAERLLRIRDRHPERGFAILYLDLDRFRRVNESLGHGAGDEALVRITRRLQENVRGEDTAARIGGDEFAVLLPESAEDVIQRAASRLHELLEEPLGVEGEEVHLSVSVGAAEAREEHATAEQLLREAEIAMYGAKEAEEPSELVVFAPGMGGGALDRMRLEADLRAGLERDELELHYQPIVSLPDGETVALEALVRWRHPERGLLYPDAFLRMAEDAGLLGAVDRRVRRAACEDVARWKGEGCLGPETAVHLNVSPHELGNPELISEVKRDLEAHEISPSRLVLEVTEETLVERPEEAARELEKLASTGVSICIDDFGTGHATLSYLRRFRADVVKVDREFMRDLGEDAESRSILRAVLALGEELAMKVVAEGVETADQLDELVDLGAELAQGFLWSRPVPARRIRERLWRERRSRDEG